MLNFRKATIEDKQEVEKYFQKSGFMCCECSFANLLMWQDDYNSYICIHNDTLYVKTMLENKNMYFSPISIAEKPIKQRIETLMQEENIDSANILVVCNDYKNCLEKDFFKNSQFECMPDNYDYIYNYEDLANLSGKKYHAKRNHISKFISTYGEINYTEINKDNLKQVIDFDRKWRKENNMENTADERAVKIAFDNYERLSLKGGFITVDSKVVAYTFGSKINDLVFDVNAEKADYNYQGAYAVINREFVRNSLCGYKFINREEDLGIDGLRKAKMSYNPELLLKKCMCVIKK